MPDPPDFSPEAIAEAIANELVGVRAAPFDLTITEGEAQVVAARIMEHVSPLLAALEAAEKERDEATAALSGAIDGTNDLLDTLLRAEKARAVRTTANAIREAGRR